MARRGRPPKQPPSDDSPSPERREFAENLKRYRSRAGLTQAELAEKSGISQPHISELESAAWEPRLVTLLSLARALGIAPADLLPSSEPEKK